MKRINFGFSLYRINKKIYDIWWNIKDYINIQANKYLWFKSEICWELEFWRNIKRH